MKFCLEEMIHILRRDLKDGDILHTHAVQLALRTHESLEPPELSATPLGLSTHNLFMGTNDNADSGGYIPLNS